MQFATYAYRKSEHPHALKVKERVMLSPSEAVSALLGGGTASKNVLVDDRVRGPKRNPIKAAVADIQNMNALDAMLGENCSATKLALLKRCTRLGLCGGSLRNS